MKKFKAVFFRHKNKKNRKSLKGMTLMEIIIAMVVLVVISTMIAEAGVGVVNNVRASKSVIEKVNYQSKYISGQRTKYQGIGDDGSGGVAPVEKDMTKTSLTYQLVDSTGANLGNPISADVYAAPGMDVAYEYKDGTYKMADGTAYDRAGNLKYFD